MADRGIRRRLKRWIRSTAVKWAMTRPSPDRIPLTGEVVYSRNYFTVYLGDSLDEHLFVAQSTTEQGIKGLWFNQGSDAPSDASVSYSTLPDIQITIKHYANELEVTFHSALEFITHQLLGIDWVKVGCERALGKLFNSKPLVRAERMKVLDRIVQCTFKKRDFQTSP
jgi:hypothetical protein